MLPIGSKQLLVKNIKILISVKFVSDTFSIPIEEYERLSGHRLACGPWRTIEDFSFFLRTRVVPRRRRRAAAPHRCYAGIVHHTLK